MAATSGPRWASPSQDRPRGEDDPGLERPGIRGDRRCAGTQVHAQQVRERTHDLLGALAGESAERDAQLGPGDGRPLRRPEAQRAAEDLDDRGVTRALGIGLAAALEPAHALGQVVTDLRLAHPGSLHPSGADAEHLLQQAAR
jgi:hypothetical protein